MQSNKSAKVQNKEVDKEVEETPALLMRLLNDFTKQHGYYAARRVRYEGLLQRKHNKKWSPKKMTNAVNRLMVANKEEQQFSNMIEQVKFRLNQIQHDSTNNT